MQIAVDIKDETVCCIHQIDESSLSNGSTNGDHVDEVASLSFVNAADSFLLVVGKRLINIRDVEYRRWIDSLIEASE